MKDVILMKQGLGIPILMMLFIVIWIPNLINKKDYLIKENKIIILNKNQKGHIVYKLKKGRYNIRISPNVDYIDSYIVGENAEFNPTIDGDALVYEIDTNKKVENFKQEYKKTDKTCKLKIEIEKIE